MPFANTTNPNFFKPRSPHQNHRDSEKASGSGSDTENQSFSCSKYASACNHEKLCWVQPSLNSVPIDFCQNTSLHGLKYISQSKRHLSERLFWLLTFCIGLSIAVYLISDVWRKYNDSPVIVSFDPYETNIGDIPFPAVTICNNNKLLKSRATMYNEQLHKNINDKEALESYYYLTQVCLSSKSFTNKFDYSLFQYNETLLLKSYEVFNRDVNSQRDIQEFLRKNSQKCSDMIPLCIFKGKPTNCSELFNSIVTDFGKCCTFNMIPNLLRYSNNTYRVSDEEAEEWELAKLDNSGVVFDHSQIRTKYPRRQIRAGRSFGLSIVLDPNLNEYYCTNSDSYGFQLSLHLSAEIPNSIEIGYGIQPNSEIFLSMYPEITKADSSIYGYALEKRQCYLAQEYNLTYYKYYTVLNCLDECVAQEVLKQCGCVRFYMPRDASLKLCNPSKFNCTDSAKASISDSEYGLKKICKHCLPLCTEIHFGGQMTSIPLQEKKDDLDIWRNSKQEVPWANHKVSIVHIYFDQDSTYSRLRKELFGFTDLIANTGGLMGLCLGFSALSGVEVIYFLTLRNLCQRKRKQSIKAKVVQLWKKSKRIGRKLNGSKPKVNHFVPAKAFEKLRDNFVSNSKNTAIHNANNTATAANKPSDLAVIDLLSSKDLSQNNIRHNFYANQYWNPIFD